MPEWNYLREVLHRFGLGGRLIFWIQLLCAEPTARFGINDSLSVSFPLFHGTRQGCTLSPLLFALALEPLVAMVRALPTIVGFRQGHREDLTLCGWHSIISGRHCRFPDSSDAAY